MSKVEIPVARNLAERVTGLLSVKYPQLKDENIVNRIKELEDEYGLLDHAVAFKIAEEIAKQKFCKFKDQLEAIDAGLRVAFAYLTVGVVAAPLEGYTHFNLKKTKDGKDYFSLYFSGPIGAAGRTIATIFVVIADYLRNVFGYAKYDPTEEEVNRAVTEIYDRHERVTNLQYLPTIKEIEFLYKRLPVQLNGDPTETKEVSNYKDLERIETNLIRSGFCLILGEGISQKAPKVVPVLAKLKDKGIKLEGWEFLKEFVDLQKSLHEEKKAVESSAVYIQDLVAGRPVLGHPSAAGGFRLRYGKCRTNGLSSMAMHPLTMELLRKYIAVGTQLKYEGPGKSSAMSLCDDIEGPIVKLDDGSVIQVDSKEKAEKVKAELKEVLFLGDFLVNYAEYFNRGKPLQKPGYCEEWYALELEKASLKKLQTGSLKNLIADWRTPISFEEAIEFSKTFSIPLYPKYIFYWTQIDQEQFLELLCYFSNAIVSEGKLILPYRESNREKFAKAKRALELIGAEHKVALDNLVLPVKVTKSVFSNLGLPLGLMNKNNYKLKQEIDEALKSVNLEIKKSKKGKNKSVLDLVNSISEFKIKDKTGSFIGARMGRPEKAKLRKLVGSPNVLFPVGEEGGRFRSVNTSAELGFVKADFPIHKCTKCDKETIYYLCEDCGSKTVQLNYCRECQQTFEALICPKHKIGQKYSNRKIDMKHFLKAATSYLGVEQLSLPPLIKGVRGTSNKHHIPENLAKGILRVKYNLSVNKDGTIRYDLTEMPLTHFRPKEIGTSVERLKELGYKFDKDGKELESDDQLVEIFPQDVILPACPDSADEKADDVFVKVSQYVDELLLKFYHLKEFYKIKKREDLVGHLILGLAPHTSAAIIGRVIGFNKTQACLSNPMWHAAQRRDCEGDETCIILLLDALINFSREFLPARRGATQDAPLVITSKLIPAEIDDMAFDIDLVWKYPLEFYQAAEQEKNPWDIKIEQLKDRLGKESAYSNFGFTHTVKDINNAIVYSAYKQVPTMAEKVEGQMWIAEKLRSVDEADVAKLIIDRHFIRDLRGNLRKFSQQQFRCVACNTKFRRPPLAGKCTKCQGKIILTVSYGTIVKYLEPAIQLAEKYDVPAYIKESLLLAKRYIESIFGKEKEKQEALEKWVS